MFGLLNRAGWVLDTVRDHVYLNKLLPIGPKDVVLDVGSGASPCIRSNVLCDKFVADATERHGQAVKTDRPFVVADAARLPFADKSFDFVICSHVLEHVPDPALVISELQRVASRGYIETPSAGWEKVVGFPFHRWMVSSRDGKLIFERKRAQYFDPELREWFARSMQSAGLHDQLWKARRRAHVYTALVWEGTIRFEVRDAGGGGGFVHAELDGDDHEEGTTASGVATRLIDRWGKHLRRHSDIGWPELQSRLACPDCRGALAHDKRSYSCAQCGGTFPLDAQSRPRLLPHEGVAAPV